MIVKLRQRIRSYFDEEGRLASALVLFFLLIVIYAGLQFTWVKLLALAALIGIGWFLFKLRTDHRMFYGIGEVCVGIAICWVGLNGANTEGLASAMPLAAGVYVIVRGLDNCQEGTK